MTVYTGWIFTDATNLVDCSHCGSKAGESCKRPKGGESKRPHAPRVYKYRGEHPDGVAETRRQGRL